MSWVAERGGTARCRHLRLVLGLDGFRGVTVEERGDDLEVEVACRPLPPLRTCVEKEQRCGPANCESAGRIVRRHKISHELGDDRFRSYPCRRLVKVLGEPMGVERYVRSTPNKQLRSLGLARRLVTIWRAEWRCPVSCFSRRSQCTIKVGRVTAHCPPPGPGFGGLRFARLALDHDGLRARSRLRMTRFEWNELGVGWMQTPAPSSPRRNP